MVTATLPRLASKHGPKMKLTRQAIRDLKPFNTSGALSARTSVNDFGILPAQYVRPLRDSIRDHNLDYVVYSWETPIAWHDDYGWHNPPVKYSATTSAHQSVVRLAITTDW